MDSFDYDTALILKSIPFQFLKMNSFLSFDSFLREFYFQSNSKFDSPKHKSLGSNQIG